MNALSRIPWKLSAQSKRVVLSDGDIRICEAQTVDAAFIVRACNSHEALVAALEALIPWHVSMVDGLDRKERDDFQESIIQARNALALAKGAA